jgi:antitoxin YefM
MYIKSNMLSANVTDFRKEIKKYLDLVIEDFETLIINRGKGKGAVMISLDEYNSLMETMYLLSTKANRDSLYESIKQIKEGKVVVKELKDLTDI